jgi:7-carboxy-7-deazaguanine synthase
MRICEMFRSIQGEGKLIGVPTYFIRSVGCNLDCEWCDTKYSSDGGTEMTVDEILDRTKDERYVCLTGGEPMIQKEFPELLNGLLAAGKHVTIETNGSVHLGDIPDSENVLVSMDIKCPSSKMTDRMLWENIPLMKPKDQLKFVLSDEGDFDFAVDVVRRYRPDTEIIFSPVGGLDVRTIAERVVECGLNVRVLIQLHKVIWGNMRGV